MSNGDEDNEGLSNEFAQGVCAQILWNAVSENGDVPSESSQCSKEQSLAVWQKDVSTAHRRNTLTPQQLVLLEAIDFPFPTKTGGKFALDFDVFLSAANKWKAQNGEAHFTMGRSTKVDGVKIGKFAATLRETKKKKDQGKNVELTDAQIQALNNAGMVWQDVSHFKWKLKYDMLIAFNEANGHPNPAQGDALGNWVSHQRRKRKEGKLEQDYIDKLNAFENFKW